MSIGEHRGSAARKPWTRRGALLLALLLGCGGSTPQSKGASDLEDEDAARYRLLLRENPVDPGQAFRCYGGCQSQGTPQGYLQCLAECPGFEITEGVRCSDREVPPIAACFTVRQAPKGSEPAPGWVVLAVIANVALIVTLASVCSSSSQCGYGGFYPYTPGPAPPPF